MLEFFSPGVLWLLNSIYLSILAFFSWFLSSSKWLEKEGYWEKKKCAPGRKKIFENGACWLKNHLQRLRPYSIYLLESSSKKTDYNPPNPEHQTIYTSVEKKQQGLFSKKEKVHLWPGLLNPWANAAMGSDLWCRNNYTRTFMGSHRRSFKQTLRPLGSILDLLWTACKHQQGGVLYAGSVARYFQCLSRHFIGIWWIARLILWNETIPHIW